MLKKIINWFSKGEDEVVLNLPKNEKTVFILKVANVEVGKLQCANGLWEFIYSDVFKNEYGDEYKRITGFPDLNKVYKNENLWPFFLTRIPGLKQPAIKEIVENENIDIHNEAALLKRFGQRTISNPYELVINDN